MMVDEIKNTRIILNRLMLSQQLLTKVISYTYLKLKYKSSKSNLVTVFTLLIHLNYYEIIYLLIRLLSIIRICINVLFKPIHKYL